MPHHMVRSENSDDEERDNNSRHTSHSEQSSTEVEQSPEIMAIINNDRRFIHDLNSKGLEIMPMEGDGVLLLAVFIYIFIYLFYIIFCSPK